MMCFTDLLLSVFYRCDELCELCLISLVRGVGRGRWRLHHRFAASVVGSGLPSGGMESD